MTRVYLDTSIYNRPFDDQTQPKIFLETQAVSLIWQMVETQLIELVRTFHPEKPPSVCHRHCNRLGF